MNKRIVMVLSLVLGCFLWAACSAEPDSDSADDTTEGPVGEAEEEIGQGCVGGPPWGGQLSCEPGANCCLDGVGPSGRCRNLQTDPLNCGTCAHSCGSGQACSGGGCVCHWPYGLCGTTCKDKQNDPANCGTCGHVCDIGGLCTAGVCVCPAGKTSCSGTCVTTATDPNNCGNCGNVCGAGKTCIASACVCTTDAGCTGGLHCDSTHTCVACVYHDDCPAGQLCRGTPDGTGDASHGGFCSVEPLTGIYCVADADCSGATGNTVYEFGGDSDPVNNPTADNKIHCCGSVGTKKCMATAHDPKYCGASGGSCGVDLTADPNKDTCYTKMVGATWTTSSCKAGVDCPAFVGHYDRHE
jgi:hypothetical protein